MLQALLGRSMQESFLFIIHLMPALLIALACISDMVFVGPPRLFPYNLRLNVD